MSDDELNEWERLARDATPDDAYWPFVRAAKTMILTLIAEVRRLRAANLRGPNVTREQIEAMPAGREMDAEIAVHVFGWREIHPVWMTGYPPEWKGEVEPPVWPPRIGALKKVPNYSTDIAAAWQVVDRLSLGVTKFNDQWVAGYTMPGSHIRRPELVNNAVADTAPLAICRAALVAATPSSPPPPRPA